MSRRGTEEFQRLHDSALPASRPAVRMRQTGVRPSRPMVSMVIPCYNESAVMHALIQNLDAVFSELPDVDHEYVFVNDGSRDDTLKRLITLAEQRSDFVVVDLSRNFGKEAALSAGLRLASGDVVIPIDADLQDPPRLIPQMLARWREGAEVVLAKREDRSEDSFAKRASASLFYRCVNKLAEVALPENVGDFRLMDRVVIDTLNSLPENRRFMKGLFAWAGFRTVVVTYKREVRRAGQTSFNAWKLWNLALEGITGFSTVPLRIWTYLGTAVAIPAFFWGAWIAVRTMLFGVDVPGYASIMVSILFLGGLQLIGIGVMGEYIGRTYLEAKRRPAFVVRQVYRNAAA